MNDIVRILCAAALVLVALAGCKNKMSEGALSAAPTEAPATTSAGADSLSLPPGHPDLGAVAASAAPQPGALIRGKVTETMDAGSYTYVQVDDGKQKLWAATTHMDVKPGETVTVPNGIKMENYKSSALDRTFDVVYFVGGIARGNRLPAAGDPAGSMAGSTHPPMGDVAAQQMGPGGHPRVDASQAAKDAGVSFSGLQKAGVTIGELYDGQGGFAGKEVTLRGKVVKFSPRIMGTNWLHVQDGTGQPGGQDLTVTTAAEAKVGDTVLITGKVTLNKDFGMGYKYPLILEDAKVKVE